MSGAGGSAGGGLGAVLFNKTIQPTVEPNATGLNPSLYVSRVSMRSCWSVADPTKLKGHTEYQYIHTPCERSLVLRRAKGKGTGKEKTGVK